MALQLVLSLALNQFSSNMGIVFSLLSELSTKLISTQKNFEKLDLELGRLSFRFQQHGQLLNDSKIFDNLKKLRENSIYTAEEIGKAYESAFSVNNQDPERIVRIAKDVSAYLGTKPEEFVKNLRNLSVNSGVDELRQVGIKGATFLDFQKSGYTTQSQLIELVLNKLDKSVRGADESLYNRIKGRIEITNSYSDNLFKVGEVVNGILNKIYPKITSILDTLGTKVSNFLQNVDFNELFRKLEVIYNYTKDNIIPIFVTLFKIIVEIGKIIGEFGGIFLKVLEGISTLLEIIINNIKTIETIILSLTISTIIYGIAKAFTFLNVTVNTFIATNIPNIIQFELKLGILLAGLKKFLFNPFILISAGVTATLLAAQFISEEIDRINEKQGKDKLNRLDTVNKEIEKNDKLLEYYSDLKNPIDPSLRTKRTVELSNSNKVLKKEKEQLEIEDKIITTTIKKDTKKDTNKDFKGKVPPGQSSQLLAFEKSQKVNYVNITIENLNGIQNGELKIVKGDEGQAVRQLTENVSQALQYVVATTFADNSNLRQNV